VVFGAVDGDFPHGKFANVAVVIDEDAKLVGLFGKQRPVPLFRDGEPGTTRPVFPLEQGTLGVAICYDYDAPEVTATLVHAGATVLIAPNYDAMSWGKMQHVHHELLFRLRAVENDRWIVRASSSGRSEAIDPHGRPSAEGIEIGQTGTVIVGYGQRNTLPVGSFTYLLGPAAAVATLGYASWWIWKRRREVQQAESKPPEAT
jgi:apolipoprotein N-acyltransferase